MRKCLIVLFFVFLSGCMAWIAADGPFKGDGYAFDLPKGWMYKWTLTGRTVDITKDGELLQDIHASVWDIKKYKEDDKKIVKKGMLPQEVAQVAIDRLSSNKQFAQFTVLQNEPAQLAGRDGYKLVCSYRMDKVRYKSVLYGMLNGETLYRISYTAPVRYYFDRDAAAFENIVKTFRLAERMPESSGSNIVGVDTGL
ncbi:MAG TPA: hypothetical protein VK445_11515 [Dissulfurispiraceae bacterium]|nr:hypothetical protein [Dissulfurispiraceae bacterium]